MIRLGLCCIFIAELIKFRTVTAKSLRTLDREEQLFRISELCLHNMKTLNEALSYCADNNIGDFRIGSGLFPLKTHPDIGYDLEELIDKEIINHLAGQCRDFSQTNKIRTSFHPDQFIVLSSPHKSVVANSLADLDYHADLSEMIGADVINVHCGGVYGNKKESLKRLEREICKLPEKIRSRLTLENDDRSYTPDDVIPLCLSSEIPFVYDVHHHRCLQRDANIFETTVRAVSTWNREPMFHLSSPREGWDNSNPCYHSDYIDYADFPDCWKSLDITVEIEAKAKELAIKRLYQELIDDRVEVRG